MNRLLLTRTYFCAFSEFAELCYVTVMKRLVVRGPHASTHRVDTNHKQFTTKIKAILRIRNMALGYG